MVGWIDWNFGCFYCWISFVFKMIGIVLINEWKEIFDIL